MIKGAIFDFNGTLFYDSDIHTEVWRQLYEKISHGKPDFEEVFASVFGGNNKWIIDNFYASNGQKVSEEENERLSKLKEQKYREYSIEHNRCHLVKGAAELFDQLNELKMPINIASASIIENINFFFSEFGIGKWFDRKKVVYDDGQYANKIKMYEKAAENIGLYPSECLIFEDSNFGVECAYKSGCRNIVVLDPNKNKHNLPGVIKVVGDFTEFKLEDVL